MASIVMLLVSAAFVASTSGFLLDDTHCQDMHQSCAYWAGIGECTKNPNYMLESCKESCGKCGSTDPVEECYHKDRPQDYKGNKSTSATGRQCLAWNTIGGPPAQYFGDGKLPTNNFCRDIFYTKQGDDGPTPQNGEPWCYTGPTAADEEVCGVPVCQAMTPKTPTLTKDKTNPVTVGITEIFMCSSDSAINVRPTYRFFQNGVEVQAGVKPVWVIDPVTLKDNDDVYTCTLEMGGLNSLSSNSVTLEVVDKPAKPTLTLAPSDPTDGDNVVLTCASNTSGITEYEFYHMGTKVAGSSSPTYNINPSILGTNDGFYFCVAKAGEISSDNSDENMVALTPKTPTLTKDKTNPVTVGITEIFMCSSDSFLHVRPTYRFFQNGVEVQTETKPVWVIDPVSLSDNNDVYTCTLEMGGLNSLPSNSVTLEVVDA